jgi:hypothetical protein
MNHITPQSGIPTNLKRLPCGIHWPPLRRIRRRLYYKLHRSHEIRVVWMDGRAVEGARLESAYTSKAYRGFESHSIRHTKPLRYCFCSVIFRALILYPRPYPRQSPGYPPFRLISGSCRAGGSHPRARGFCPAFWPRAEGSFAPRRVL